MPTGFLGFLLSLSLAAPSADGLPRVLRAGKILFLNAACGDRGTCDLREFSMTTEDYEIRVGSATHYGTRVFAEYTTASPRAVRNYGIVQFVRGCKYSSSLENGTVHKRKDVVKKHLGHYVTFSFPRWTLDSPDQDPLYWSADGNDRHSILVDHALCDGDRGAEGCVRISDRPGTSFLLNGSALNTSLEFQTCVYRAAEVPRRVDDDAPLAAEPVHCFIWRSSFIYDYLTERFEQREGLDAFCLA